MKIQLLDAEKEVIEDYPVGNLTELGKSKYINTTIPTISVYITIKVDGWATPGMEPTRMTGQKITQEGSELYIVSDPENFTF